MRFRWGRATGAILLSLVLFAGNGCRLGNDRSDYFPLDAGWSWRYRVTSEIKNIGKEHTEMLVANRGTITVDDQKVVPRMYQDGHRYYYAAQDEGVLLVADRAVGEEVKPAQPDQFVLKYPLDPGTSWSVESRTYLLRRQIFSPTAVIMVPIRAPMPITYTIEGKDDVVRVPAGTFRNCLRIHGTATAMRDLGERIGEAEVKVDVTEWFAPGVGFIKMVRKEDTHPESPAAGSMTIELQSLNKRSWFN
jgi:hypothetical protein